MSSGDSDEDDGFHERSTFREKDPMDLAGKVAKLQKKIGKIGFIVYEDESKTPSKAKLVRGTGGVEANIEFIRLLHREQSNLSFSKKVVKKILIMVASNNKLKFEKNEKADWIETLTCRWRNICRVVMNGYIKDPQPKWISTILPSTEDHQTGTDRQPDDDPAGGAGEHGGSQPELPDEAGVDKDRSEDGSEQDDGGDEHEEHSHDDAPGGVAEHGEEESEEEDQHQGEHKEEKEDDDEDEEEENICEVDKDDSSGTTIIRGSVSAGPESEPVQIAATSGNDSIGVDSKYETKFSTELMLPLRRALGTNSWEPGLLADVGDRGDTDAIVGRWPDGYEVEMKETVGAVSALDRGNRDRVKGASPRLWEGDHSVTKHLLTIQQRCDRCLLLSMFEQDRQILQVRVDKFGHLDHQNRQPDDNETLQKALSFMIEIAVMFQSDQYKRDDLRDLKDGMIKSRNINCKPSKNLHKKPAAKIADQSTINTETKADNAIKNTASKCKLIKTQPVVAMKRPAAKVVGMIGTSDLSPVKRPRNDQVKHIRGAANPPTPSSSEPVLTMSMLAPLPPGRGSSMPPERDTLDRVEAYIADSDRVM